MYTNSLEQGVPSWPTSHPNDPYFDILQLSWMITVDFGPAWELACLEKIHLGLAGQQLTRTATYSTDHIRIHYMSNPPLISEHPCTGRIRLIRWEIRNGSSTLITSDLREAPGAYGAIRRGQHASTSLASGDQAAGELRIVEYLVGSAKLVCLLMSSQGLGHLHGSN